MLTSLIREYNNRMCCGRKNRISRLFDKKVLLTSQLTFISSTLAELQYIFDNDSEDYIYMDISGNYVFVEKIPVYQMNSY